jgi:hypothetical protein
MSQTPGSTLCVPEIVSVVRALAAVGSATVSGGLIVVPRELLVLSTRERRELRIARVLVDDGRRRC